MSYFTLPPSYKYKLNSLPRGRLASTPITHSCNVPYRAVVVDYNSNCLICSCDGWLPIPVGQVQDFATLDEVWNSPVAKILQQDIDDKKFTWCAVEHCGIKQRSIKQARYELLINIDESCNLHCPSCRRESIMHVLGPVVDKKIQDIERVLSWLESFDHPIHIVLSGNGDPLASAIIRPLIKKYKPKSNQTFKLFTNGLLIKKQLENSSILKNITEFSISVDAGSQAVYENVRRGGSWKILLENFEYLTLINKNKLVNLNFAVQQSNFKDLQNFVNICEHYNFKGVVHGLDNWGTWNTNNVLEPDAWTIKNGTFQQHDVLNIEHPQYQECKEIINKIISNRNRKITFAFDIKNKIKQ
jgi:molybdenum cofactor biosynthesis enzyme MoaA